VTVRRRGGSGGPGFDGDGADGVGVLGLSRTSAEDGRSSASWPASVPGCLGGDDDRSPKEARVLLSFVAIDFSASLADEASADNFGGSSSGREMIETVRDDRGGNGGGTGRAVGEDGAFARGIIGVFTSFSASGFDSCCCEDGSCEDCDVAPIAGFFHSRYTLCMLAFFNLPSASDGATGWGTT